MGDLESVSIRRATPDDLDGLQLVQTSALAAAHIIPPSSRDWGPFVDSSAHFIYLAEDTRPFGFVCAGLPGENVLPQGAGEIHGLYLLPAYQGHGMGGKLLVRGLSVLKRREFLSAFIWIRLESSRVMSLVSSLGFTATDLRRTTNLTGISVEEQGFTKDLESYF